MFARSSNLKVEKSIFRLLREKGAACFGAAIGK